MTEHNPIIRPIRPSDNAQIEHIIKSCFPEFDIPLTGTAYEDIDTTRMFEAYQDPRSIYFVLDSDGEVLGGGGIKPLAGAKETFCELQKMYFSPKIRGQGYGKLMFETCLKAAKELGYQTCYLESAHQLKAAIHIYEMYGFKHLQAPLGSTGHYSCGVWMIKEL